MPQVVQLLIYFSLAYFFLSLFLSHMPTHTHTHYPQFPDTQPPINSHTLSLSLTHTFSHTHSLRSVPRGEDGFWSSFMAFSCQSKTTARNISGMYVRTLLVLFIQFVLLFLSSLFFCCCNDYWCYFIRYYYFLLFIFYLFFIYFSIFSFFIFQYWLKKRDSINKPLCRRYWPHTTSSDTNPYNVFRYVTIF